MILTRDKGSRMWGGGGSVGSGGGGGLDPSALAGYATQGWVEENYVSKAFFNSLFSIIGTLKVETSTDGITWTQQSINENYEFLPNEVAGQWTEEDPDTGVQTRTTKTFVKAQVKAGVWTNSFVSALGANAGGGGGGGGVTLNEPLDSINESGLASHPSSANMTIVWNGSSWTYGSIGGGGGGGVTTLSALTDVAISSPTDGQALVWSAAAGKWINGNISSGGPVSMASLTDVNISNPSNGEILVYNSVSGKWENDNLLAEVATKTWVNNQGFLKTAGGTFWGQVWTNGNTVSGNMTDVGSITMSGGISMNGNITGVSSITMSGGITMNGGITIGGNIVMNNGTSIRMKDSGGDDKNLLTLNSSNILALGYNTRQAGYTTDIQGDPITFATNGGSSSDNRLEVGEFSEAGRFWVKQGAQGIRIGDGLLTWDSTNNAIKVERISSGSVVAGNFYATGFVSALGANAGGGGGGGGYSYLSDMLDVNISYPEDGEVLIYNGTTSKWTNVESPWLSKDGDTMTGKLYMDDHLYMKGHYIVMSTGVYLFMSNGRLCIMIDGTPHTFAYTS